MPEGPPSARPTVIPRIDTGDVDGVLGFARAVFGNLRQIATAGAA